MGILDRDRKILWARAHNSCAYCRRPLVEDATAYDLDSVVGDEAHIVARSGQGPRAGFIADDEINRYENLILLCKVHHKLIDDQSATYTVERLREMKRAHEQWAEKAIRTGANDSNDEHPEIFDHVPENSEEIDYVIGHRPWSWEYLMYAGILQVGLREVKQRTTHLPASSLILADKRTALKQVSALMDELQSIVEGIMDCFDPELMSKALGEEGRPGQWRLVSSLARRPVSLYEKLQNWSISVRSAQVPWQTRRLYELVSHMADRPMLDIEVFVNELIVQLNDAIDQRARGSTAPQVRTLYCAISADDKLIKEVVKETERAYRR